MRPGPIKCVLAGGLLVVAAWRVPCAGAAEPTTRPANVAVLSQLSLPDPAYGAAVERGDAGEGRRLLAEHFAKRPRVRFAPELFMQTFDNPKAGPAYVRDKPDLAMRNRFAFLFEYIDAGRDFDWNARFGRGDREITWWINRFFYLLPLEEAYDRTRNVAYPRHGVGLMLDWIRKNPVEKAADSWGSWRTLEIGLRLVEWSRFINRFAGERVIMPDELAVLLGSLREQTGYLAAHSGPRRGNWGFMEQLGIGTVAMVFPEFKDADRWLAGVLDVYRQDVGIQIYPDGSQEELTTHYGLVVVHSLARLLDLARSCHRPAPAELEATLRRAATYSTLTLKPDHTLPMINDGDAAEMTPFLDYLARTLDLPEAKYVLSNGREGEAPPLCRLFPHSGLAVFRDSWKPDARCLILDAGPFGTGHQHEDALGFDVSAFGRSFIVDPGRYTYVPGAWRDYFVGTRSHATILVDGGEQVRRAHRELWRAGKPIADCFAACEGLAMAAGEYNAGYGKPASAGVVHRREVLFVNHEYWVISDILTGSGKHRIEQTFQYTPGPLDVRDNFAVTGHPDANLAMLWLWPAPPQAQVREGQKDPPVGWYSDSYGRIAAAPHLTLSAELELPAWLVVVLYPFRGATGPTLRIERRMASGTGSAGFEPAGTIHVRADDRLDAIAWSGRRPLPAVRVRTGDKEFALPGSLRQMPFNAPVPATAPVR